MLRFVIYCWATANLLHPFFFLGLSYLNNEADYGGEIGVADMLSVVFTFILVSFILTLPSLIGGYIVLRIIKRIKLSVAYQFLSWIVCIPFIIGINMMIFFILLKEPLVFSFSKQLVSLVLPSILATLSASLICYRSFQFAFTQDDRDVADIDLRQSNTNIQA
jgi:hypothetical protein